MKKKKLLSISLLSVLVGALSLSACTKSNTENSNTSTPVVESESTPEKTESTPVESIPTESTPADSTPESSEVIPEKSELEVKTYDLYSAAIKEGGFTGTYEEWLESVSGAEVELQVINDIILWKYSTETEWKKLYDLKANKGATGKSAYEIYKANNPSYAGTEEDWINDLVLGTLVSTKGESRVDEDKETVGLEYKLSDDGKYYIVTGIGSEVVTTEIVIPAKYNNKPVQEIAEYAFNYRNDLTKMVIPSSVTTINDNAFYGCSSLVTLKMGVLSIGDGVFTGCSSLKDVYFNGTAADWFKNTYASKESNPMFYAQNLYVSTGTGSIYDINSKIVLDIPTSVTTLNDYALVGMNEIIGLVIPTSVTTIGKMVLNGCSKLETITVPFVGVKNQNKENASFGILFGDESYNGGVMITQTYAKTFDEDGVDETDTNDYFIPATLKNITVKGTNVEIYDYAFNNLSMIESVYIDAELKGEAIFKGCSSLNKYKFVKELTVFEHEMFANCTKLENITIPSTVTVIKERALQNTGVKELVIPKSVVEIEKEALNCCASLEKLTIPFIGANNTETEAKEETLFGYIFGNCAIGIAGMYGITQTYNSSTTVGASLPNSLKEVIVTETTAVLQGAFYGCTYIEKITFTNSNLNIIQKDAFNYCASLKELNLAKTYWYAYKDKEMTTAASASYDVSITKSDSIALQFRYYSGYYFKA